MSLCFVIYSFAIRIAVTDPMSIISDLFTRVKTFFSVVSFTSISSSLSRCCVSIFSQSSARKKCAVFVRNPLKANVLPSLISFFGLYPVSSNSSRFADAINFLSVFSLSNIFPQSHHCVYDTSLLPT